MRKLILLLLAIICYSANAQNPIFYDDIDYGGTGWNVDCGRENPRLEDFNSSFWGGFYGGCYAGPCNWRVSSIKIPKGCKVTLYDQFGFQGNSITFTTDQPNLVNVGWNDRASSIRIQGNVEPTPVQQQRCGGNVVFLNRSNRTVYLYGANVSKYQASNFYMCDYYKGAIAPGYSWAVNVPEGQAFNFAIYEERYGQRCSGNNIVASGIYQDCQAVGQYHTIDF